MKERGRKGGKERGRERDREGRSETGNGKEEKEKKECGERKNPQFYLRNSYNEKLSALIE